MHLNYNFLANRFNNTFNKTTLNKNSNIYSLVISKQNRKLCINKPQHHLKGI